MRLDSSRSCHPKAVPHYSQPSLKLTQKKLPHTALSNQHWFSKDLEGMVKKWRLLNIHTLKDTSSKGEIFTKIQIEEKIKGNLPWMFYFQLCSVFSRKAFCKDLKTTPHTISTIISLK